MLGAMLAFVLISYFFSQSGQNLPAAVQKIPEGKEFAVLLAEFIGSMIFAFSVAQVTSQKQHNSTAVALGVCGGLMLALIIAGFATTVIQASSIFNPAVAIAIQAFTVEGTNTLWAIATYLGGALLGGITGFGFSLLLQNNSEK